MALALIFTICLLYFLFTLNLYLRGSARELIAGVLGLIMTLAQGFAFYRFGWKVGLAAVAVPLVFVNLMRPLAASLAYRKLGFRTGLHEDPGRGNFERLMNGRSSFEKYHQQFTAVQNKRRKRLKALLARPSLHSVVERHHFSMDDFEELYSFLLLCGLEDIALDILAKPDTLDRAITLRKSAVTRSDMLRVSDELRQ